MEYLGVIEGAVFYLLILILFLHAFLFSKECPISDKTFIAAMVVVAIVIREVY